MNNSVHPFCNFRVLIPETRYGFRYNLFFEIGLFEFTTPHLVERGSNDCKDCQQ